MEAIARVAFGLFGLAVLVGLAWLFSSNKKSVDWKLVATGVALQIAFAALVLLVPGGKDVFDALGRGFVKLLEFTGVGTQLIFGELSSPAKFGFIFAFQVLPTIIFFAALMGMLYHLGVMQWIVRGMAWAITKVMRVSGAETTSVCASVFIGQTEAPLTIRPYLGRMTAVGTADDHGRRHGAHRRRRARRLRRACSAAAIPRSRRTTPSTCLPPRSWPRRRRW